MSETLQNETEQLVARGHEVADAAAQSVERLQQAVTVQRSRIAGLLADLAEARHLYELWRATATERAAEIERYKEALKRNAPPTPLHERMREAEEQAQVALTDIITTALSEQEAEIRRLRDALERGSVT